MSDKYDSTELRVSYGIGRQMGDQLRAQPFAGMSVEAVLDGLSDALNGAPSAVPDQLLEAAFQELSQKLQAEQAERGKQMAQEGENFLAENAKRETVTVTDSGLQYEILNEGTGPRPGPASTVRTHYHGTLIDGSVFDSSYQRGQPAEFPVNGVIAGWTEALQMMPVGSKWRLYIPYQLAYGEQGAGGAIAPYSALIFDVELLDIV